MRSSYALTTLAEGAFCAARMFQFISFPQQKSPSNRRVEHLLGRPVHVSNTNRIARQAQNYFQLTDTTRSPLTHLPNHGSDNSKSWSTTACGIPGSGCRQQPLPGLEGCKRFPVRFFP